MDVVARIGLVRRNICSWLYNKTHIGLPVVVIVFNSLLALTVQWTNLSAHLIQNHTWQQFFITWKLRVQNRKYMPAGKFH